MSIESVMPSNHLILCHPLLLLPSIFSSIRIFSNESVLRIRWPKYWSSYLSVFLRPWMVLGTNMIPSNCKILEHLKALKKKKKNSSIWYHSVLFYRRCFFLKQQIPSKQKKKYFYPSCIFLWSQFIKKLSIFYIQIEHFHFFPLSLSQLLWNEGLC